MAVLLTYGFRGTGLIGRLIAVLNALMLLSLPSIGGHYLIDMIAGAVLALVAIAAYRAAGGWFGHKFSPQVGSPEPAPS
jgi:membrane-associated phospholipid phosphatase